VDVDGHHEAEAEQDGHHGGAGVGDEGRRHADRGDEAHDHGGVDEDVEEEVDGWHRRNRCEDAGDDDARSWLGRAIAAVESNASKVLD